MRAASFFKDERSVESFGSNFHKEIVVALCIHSSHIHGFNQPRIENALSKKCHVVAEVHCVVGPTMVVVVAMAGSVLNLYRLFFLSSFPKQYSTPVYHLHGISIVLSIISNLEMLYSAGEDFIKGT